MGEGGVSKKMYYAHKINNKYMLSKDERKGERRAGIVVTHLHGSTSETSPSHYIRRRYTEN